ncbi:hypothetical protein Z043_122039 [Scleropages formosus]|uniref:Uncharacterized protein n=1 Tax=Scleropages formosus TaxID=113540 RepID=A0A0P7WAI8_SCLFO|nr:hypothetical protein Z043_122039 [Scleropages formosus]
MTREAVDGHGLDVPLLSSGPCCGDSLLGNGTCRSSAHCGPGCYPRVSDNDTARCVPCDSELPGQDNVTSCNYTDAPGKENMTTLATAMPKIGGPGVAASLLLGTLLISLFLILSVASFFYLKRSNRLPALFYRRKNGCHDIYACVICAEAKVRQEGTAVGEIGVRHSSRLRRRHRQHSGRDQGQQRVSWRGAGLCDSALRVVRCAGDGG